MAYRPYDQFGIGWYNMNVSNSTFTTNNFGTLELLRNEQGFEAYYSFALTPWAFLTPDVQVVQPAQKATRYGQEVNTATVLGLRLRLVF